MLLKIDLINEAYSKLRISGVTVQPTAFQRSRALTRLENMIREFQGRNICVSWEVVDQPDFNDYHNLEPMHYDAVSTLLAKRLLVDFGKPLTQELNMMASAASSLLYSTTAVKEQTHYPARMPRGRGNRHYRTFSSHRMPRIVTPPPDCTETFTMWVGDIQDYTEHYEAYLKDGEEITSFTIEADTGIKILSSSNTVTDIDYQLEATGDSGENKSLAWVRVKIVMTTTDGRIDTRIKNFTLNEVVIA